MGYDEDGGAVGRKVEVKRRRWRSRSRVLGSESELSFGHFWSDHGHQRKRSELVGSWAWHSGEGLELQTQNGNL